MSNSLAAVHPELIAEWSEKIDILREYLCKQRGIKLIKLPMNGNSNRVRSTIRGTTQFQSIQKCAKKAIT